MFFLSFIKKYDWPMIISACGLVALGLIELASIGQGNPVFFWRQATWFCVSLIVLFLVSSIDYRMFRHYSVAVLSIYTLGVILLGIVLVGGSSLRGVQGWIQLGPFEIAPVEFVKIAAVLLLAKYLAQRHIEIYRFRHVLVSGMYIALPAALVLAQPEFGSFIILAGIWASMMLASGIPVRHILFVSIVAVSCTFFAWHFMFQDYQRARIVSFLDAGSDPQGRGYQALQSHIAVGSAGLWGKGFGQGTQTQLSFLPEPHTDFIFAAFVEELGLVGAAFLLGFLSLLVWRIVRLAIRADNNFARFAAVGFAAMITIQAFINIGMNIGIMPITGIPLPLVSYGGSSMVSIFMGLGFLQSISMRMKV